LLFDTAKLAVRMLDDTLLTFPSAGHGVHVGVMGFADALAKLGVSYADEQACDLADAIGRTLARACHAGSSELLAERGPFNQESAPTPSIGYGLGSARRHPYLTCVVSQPSLAQFANQSSDALDPLSGSAWDLDSRWAVTVEKTTMELEPLLLQQIAIRTRLQPWVDLPLAYPLVYSGAHPSDKTVERCRERARKCGLPPPSFRRSELPLSGLG
jgi:ribonucleoside-diphosphate reductase alpha chain